MKNVRLKLSKEAMQVYTYLNKQAPNSKHEGMILKALNQKIELIKVNPHFGDPMAKKLIPNECMEKYNALNLFRVELPGFWRMLYTLTNDETQI
tara:strand:+ start:3990 stop:4271 length:282 start_codon:yes stop_codon:yes gene_type:complete